MQTKGGDTGVVHQSALHMTFTCEFRGTSKYPGLSARPTHFSHPQLSRSYSCVDWPALLERCLTYIFVRMESTASVFRAAGFLLMLLADLVAIVYFYEKWLTL